MTTGRIVALAVVLVLTGGLAGYKAWMMLKLRHEERDASRRAGLGALHTLVIGVSGAIAVALGASIRRYVVWIIVALALAAAFSIWWDRRERTRMDHEAKDR